MQVAQRPCENGALAGASLGTAGTAANVVAKSVVGSMGEDVVVGTHACTAGSAGTAAAMGAAAGSAGSAGSAGTVGTAAGAAGGTVADLRMVCMVDVCRRADVVLLVSAAPGLAVDGTHAAALFRRLAAPSAFLVAAAADDVMVMTAAELMLALMPLPVVQTVLLLLVLPDVESAVCTVMTVGATPLAASVVVDCVSAPTFAFARAASTPGALPRSQQNLLEHSLLELVRATCVVA